MSDTAKADAASDRDQVSEGDDEYAKVTGVVLMAAIVSAVSALLYGYDTGIISGALLQISDDFDIGSTLR